MNQPPGADELWIVGTGRLGLALGLLLHRAGAVRSLHYSGRAPAPPDHPLFASPPPPATYRDDLRPPGSPSSGILLALPDAALAGVAEQFAARLIPPGTPVLHLSGALGNEVLEPLRAAGLEVGGLHPLAAVADAITGAERLRGVWWGVEAEGGARALAERIVRAAEGFVLRVQPGRKATYHAAAVFASNYVVALVGVAERLMARAGVPPPDAREAIAALADGAVRNARALGPAAALTGPVSRGDLETLRAHLASLSQAERTLYSPLARAALQLARERGLLADVAGRIEALLEEER